MSRHLAHLNALRAFEASARLGSFTRAAEELGVTPAAVGQQVRVLENYLGLRVFRRTPGGLRPTETAALALADLHGGFDRLEAGFQRLRGPVSDRRLSVSAAPALAGRWLAPRLQRLYEGCPQIDLRMDTSLGLADIAGGEFDVAIRYGEEEREGLMSPVILEEHILPVCTPELCDFKDGRPSDERLSGLPLLHIERETSDAGVPSWRDWGLPHGIRGDFLDRGPRYPHSIMALQAALDSQGIALCGLTLVIDDLVAGRLVAPYGPAGAVKTRFSYRIVYAPARRHSATQSSFINWIKKEASQTRTVIESFLSRPRIESVG